MRELEGRYSEWDFKKIRCTHVRNFIERAYLIINAYMWKNLQWLSEAANTSTMLDWVGQADSALFPLTTVPLKFIRRA